MTITRPVHLVAWREKGPVFIQARQWQGTSP